jgi:hypothetical protein
MRFSPTCTRVAQVFKRDRCLLEGHQHADGRAAGVGDVVGERFPRPLHGFPERLELVRFGPVQVLVLELKLAWADPDVVPLLLLGVEAAEAIHNHRVLSVGVRKSETVALRDPVMPVTDGFSG